MTHPNPDPLYVPELEPNDVLAAGIRRGIAWAIVLEVVVIAVVFALVVAFLAPRAAAMSDLPAAGEDTPIADPTYANVGISGTATEERPRGASLPPAVTQVARGAARVGTEGASLVRTQRLARHAVSVPATSAVLKESAPSLNSVEPNVSSLPLATVSGLSGTATWYCGQGSDCTRGYGPLDMVAAIDPTTGIDKGERVRVTHAGKSITVTVVDVCLCKGDRVIDLTSGAFLRLANTSLGVIPVELVSLGRVKLPDTSTEEP